MHYTIAQSLQNIEDATDGAPEPKTPSAATTPNQGETPGVAAVATGSALRYERTLFVLSNAGRILCLSPDQGEEMKALMASGWNHTATIDPALWIKALMEAEPNRASDMMDELNFRPNTEIRREPSHPPKP